MGWTLRFIKYKWKVKVRCTVVSDSSRFCGLQPVLLLCPWNSQARVLEWVASPFSRASSWPRDQTQFSCIAGRFFTNWATKEALARCNTQHINDVFMVFKEKESESEVTQSYLTLCHPVDCSLLLRPWDFPGKRTGVGCHFLLQGIFPTRGSNLGLLHCRQMLYHLSHQGSRKKRKGWVYACLLEKYNVL